MTRFVVRRCFGCFALLFGCLMFLPGAQAAFRIVPISTGLNQPTHVAQAPGDNGSLYIMERVTPSGGNPNANLGRILKHDLTTGDEMPFLDLSNVGGSVPADSGLLTMAFHPDFETNGKFYVTLAATPNPITNQLREYKMIEGVPTFQRTLLQYGGTDIHTIDWIGFKPGSTGAESNYMYITTGDGGPQASSASYTNKAQYLDNIYGKVLRVDVSDGLDAYPGDANKNFGIPTENPFVGQADKLGEIIASGFRNPWRASFDSATGDMYIGDVGFTAQEEISFIKAGTQGQDFGWPTREGMLQPPPFAHGGIAGPPAETTMINPILVRNHGTENSVTGGFVYHGPITELQGKYIYADHITHRINTFDFNRDTLPQNYVGNNVTNFTNATSLFNSSIVGGGTITYVTSFAEDANGNLFIVQMADGSGSQYSSIGEGIIYYLLPLPLIPGDFDSDNDVDGADFVVWQTNFPTATGATLADGDADGDGDVDGADFVVWQTNFPNSGGAGGVVPEPAAGLLALTALAALALRRASRF